MAHNTYATGSSEAVTLWAKKTLSEGLLSSIMGPLIGTSEDSFIQRLDKKGEAGDTKRVTLFTELTGGGKQGSQTLEGDEESVSDYTQDVVINLQRHATKFENGISTERVTYDQREIHRKRLSNWWSKRFSVSAINHLTGNKDIAITDTTVTGNNTVSAADANHIFRPASAGTDQAMNSSTYNASLSIVDVCRAKGESFTLADGTGCPMRPGDFMGQSCYVWVIHPNVWYDIKTSTATGGYIDLSKAFYQGSEGKNPVVKGMLRGQTRVVAEYNNTIIMTDPRCPKGYNSTSFAAVANTRRGFFMGAQALFLMMGKDYDGPDSDGIPPMKWREQERDYGLLTGIAAELIFGTVKARFNSIDQGVIVTSTYSTLG